MSTRRIPSLPLSKETNFTTKKELIQALEAATGRKWASDPNGRSLRLYCLFKHAVDERRKKISCSCTVNARENTDGTWHLTSWRRGQEFHIAECIASQTLEEKLNTYIRAKVEECDNVTHILTQIELNETLDVDLSNIIVNRNIIEMIKTHRLHVHKARQRFIVDSYSLTYRRLPDITQQCHQAGEGGFINVCIHWKGTELFKTYNQVCIVDGAAKTVNGMTLCVACGVDGAGKTFPFAWVWSPTEHEDVLTYFFMMLKGIFEKTGSTPVFFMTDGGSGLVKASGVFDNCHCLLCVWHLSLRWRIIMSHRREDLFWQMARCSDRAVLDQLYKEAETLVVGKKKPRKWLTTLWENKDQWCHAYIPDNSIVRSSQRAEGFIGVIKSSKKRSMYEVNVEIDTYLQQYMTSSLKKERKSTSTYTGYVSRLAANYKEQLEKNGGLVAIDITVMAAPQPSMLTRSTSGPSIDIPTGLSDTELTEDAIMLEIKANRKDFMTCKMISGDSDETELSADMTSSSIAVVSKGINLETAMLHGSALSVYWERDRYITTVGRILGDTSNHQIDVPRIELPRRTSMNEDQRQRLDYFDWLYKKHMRPLVVQNPRAAEALISICRAILDDDLIRKKGKSSKCHPPAGK
eukprot:gnl/Dysnectes_brevis/5522_a7979_376.p1 GENE.gnl/Dysnectes_brevis/5522_a7979_376~~gnl/Dysnectes_brevis/5522_a7979_376.p1  ORF type:complete len:634 (+),score=69.01 gnl/Dysnectes_brevis/5522_a7979_376:876-2777(+)